jgi:hypothetical protein
MAEYVVVVTYGTVRDLCYAKTTDRDGAEKLKALAISLGYKDARIESREVREKHKDEKHLRKETETHGRSAPATHATAA